MTIETIQMWKSCCHTKPYHTVTPITTLLLLLYYMHMLAYTKNERPSTGVKLPDFNLGGLILGYQ